MPKLHNAMGASHNAYIKAMLGHHPKKYPADFVETLIDEKKKTTYKGEACSKKQSIKF